MQKIKNKGSVPSTPKAWTAPNGRKIHWLSVHETYETFVKKVMDYCDANSFTRPALDALEDIICQQMSSWACIGEAQYRANQSPPKQGATYAGCSACGKKKG